jgi:hypothetical protein
LKKLEEANKQKDEVVWDNEKLAFILQQKDEKLDNLKQDYEIFVSLFQLFQNFVLF